MAPAQHLFDVVAVQMRKTTPQQNPARCLSLWPESALAHVLAEKVGDLVEKQVPPAPGVADLVDEHVVRFVPGDTQ